MNLQKRMFPIVLAFAAASQASAGVVYTGLERSASVGGLPMSSSDLFSVFDADLEYDEDTGGVFIGASADAEQYSQLSDISQTLAFDGSARASGGAVSGASASTELLLSFLVETGSSLELRINGFVRAHTGGGIDPGSSGGVGSARLQIRRGGNAIYTRSTGQGIVNIFQTLSLDSGSYELHITLSGSDPAQAGGGSGSAELDFEFNAVPAPSSAMLLCAAGVLASRRRRA